MPSKQLNSVITCRNIVPNFCFQVSLQLQRLVGYDAAVCINPFHTSPTKTRRWNRFSIIWYVFKFLVVKSSHGVISELPHCANIGVRASFYIKSFAHFAFALVIKNVHSSWPHLCHIALNLPVWYLITTSWSLTWIETH